MSVRNMKRMGTPGALRGTPAEREPAKVTIRYECPLCGADHARAACPDADGREISRSRRRAASPGRIGWDTCSVNVAELNRLDRAMVELHAAERDGVATRRHLEAVIDAWLWMDPAAQACKLKYFHEDQPYGASLRAVLDTAVLGGYDLGATQAERDAEKGEPWP